jgi:hypothetical protein
LQTWLTTLSYMGPSFVGQLPALLSALMHPSLPPQPSFDAIDWTWRWQLATALLISKLDTGWNGSQRRLGLLAMAHGPVDWVVSASIVAMGLVFAECPESRPELSQLFGALRKRTPDIGYCAYSAALEATTMRLPGIDEASRRAAFRRLVQVEKKPFLG